MIQTPDIQRPPQDVIEALRADRQRDGRGELSRLGIRDAHLRGITSWTPGKAVVGPALTLQFMPKREDVYGVDEYADPEKQLHRHVLYHTQPGDIVVVDARGDLGSGVFGEMMLTYFKGRGGVGVVIDGCIRDYPKARTSASASGCAASRRTSTPRRTSSPSPSTCRSPAADTLVMPGDIIVADDDGAVVVPATLAPELLRKAGEHAEWEEFSRMRLSRAATCGSITRSPRRPGPNTRHGDGRRDRNMGRGMKGTLAG